MIYQEYYNNKNRGIILSDILIAMSLGVLFVVTVTQTSVLSREIFASARERERLLDVYETHKDQFIDMMPHESRTIIFDSDGWKYSTTTMSASARWYGNDRIQTDITVSSDSSDKILASSSISSSGSFHGQSVTFNNVRAYPFSNMEDFSGTSLCSVDFSNSNKLSSYSSSISTKHQKPDPKITAIILPGDPLLPMTDFQVRNGKAYISTDSAKASDPDILVVDISGADDVVSDAVEGAVNATLLSSINTGPGISAIALAGNRIFSAVTSRVSQLQIIKIESINNLIIESNYKLPLPYATATPALGSAIFYDKNLVYLGTEKWDGEEFSIIDVSDLMKPVRIGSIETNSKIGSIFVRSGIAYLASSDEKQLQRIDVSDPTNPFPIDSFDPSGWERQEGKSLSFFEDVLGFGRTSGGFNIKKDHELFSWDTLSSSSSLSSQLPYSVDISGGVYGVVTDRSYIYLATRQLDKEFQIFDRDLATSTVKNVSLPVAPKAMTCDGDNIYILAGTAAVIYRILLK